jgi:hypothetical protein
MSIFVALSPNLRTPNPGFNLGCTPFNIATNPGFESRVNLRVWRPEMWVLDSDPFLNVHVAKFS